jgi:hypothetical protein
MQKAHNILILAVGVAGIVLAQQQIASVSSPASFTLRGATVTPGQGVGAWPVLAGDTVKAGGMVTTLTFNDGSAITLDPGADAKITSLNGKPMFQLLSGSAHYALRSVNAVQLMAGNKNVSPAHPNDVLTAGSKAANAGFWTAGHTVAIAAAGAAAAVGAGVGVAEATSGGPSVSPH